MTQYFSRPDLAAQMAKQLIHPGVLDQGLRSGLFISGQRRTGKTTFLLRDLIPALEHEGALVIYVDLWSDLRSNPAHLVRAAIVSALQELQTPGSSMLARLSRVSGVDAGGFGTEFGFKFGFKLEKLGEPGGITLAQAITELVDQSKRDVVLVVDEVQQAITTDDGNELLLALKAARDAVNPRPDTLGHFIFLGTGSHRALVSELTTRRQQAFNGATSIAYPVLDADYVDFILTRLTQEGAQHLPSMDAAVAAFRTVGNRPEELLRALRQLQMHPVVGGDPSATLPIIAATLRTSMADIELTKVEQMGALATAVFDRIASTESDARGIFSVEAAADYTKVIGREVKVEDIQPVVNELMGANLIMRRGHGLYGITDPFVQEAWRDRQAVLKF